MNQLMIHGTALSKLRKQSALNFEREITDIIHEIGIENGQVKIELEVIEPNKNGINKCSILFSANKGVAPQSLKTYYTIIGPPPQAPCKPSHPPTNCLYGINY